MQTVKINVSGPVRIGARVRVIGGPLQGVTGTVAWSDLQQCGIVCAWNGCEVTAQVRLHLVIRADNH
jgi:hypothetical protein